MARKRATRVGCWVLLVILAGVVGPSWSAPDTGIYLQPLVLTTFDPYSPAFRKNAWIAFHQQACQRDLSFLTLITDNDPDVSSKDDVLAVVIAKMMMYAKGPTWARPLKGDVHFECVGVDRYTVDDQHSRASIDDQIKARAQTTEDLFKAPCMTFEVPIAEGTGPAPYDVTVSYRITPACLKNQINETINRISVFGQIGTSGLPCLRIGSGGKPVSALTSGEWNVRIRDLTRMYYLNRQMSPQPLTEDTQRYIRDDLLTLDGRPGEEHYHLGQCGNVEYSRGTPDERLAERTWLGDTLPSVGDAENWLEDWLLRHGEFLVILAILAVILTALLGPIGASVAAMLAGLGALALTLVFIPETENHRLTIESDRYLNNWIILDESRPNNPNREAFMHLHAETQKWLLQHLQRIVREDFSEYNARPYQRYSLASIRSLYDFLPDTDPVKLAAQHVLDLASAKVAIGTNRSRRLVPFRRLMEAVGPQILGENGKFNGLMDMTEHADHQIAVALILSGDTAQAPGHHASDSAFSEMVLIGASQYEPPEAVVRLAMDKSAPYEQRISHAGAEIYSSSPGFLLTAGGVRTGPSLTIEIQAPLSPEIVLPPLYRKTDLGAAVPTTLMLTSSPPKSSLEEFLQIRGRHDQLDDEHETFDHNLCVWGGFACGYNVSTPPDMVPCFKAAVFPGADSSWTFFDSETCPGYASHPLDEQPAASFEPHAREAAGPPRVLIARYISDGCAADTSGDCESNIGFFEAATVDPAMSLKDFETRILSGNRSSFARRVSAGHALLEGVYHSWSGHDITFNTAAHQLNEERTGIEAVDGKREEDLDSWARAEGDVMSGDGKRFRFVNPSNGHGFTIDFANWQHPLDRDDF